jgi:hypothetical protein
MTAGEQLRDALVPLADPALGPTFNVAQTYSGSERGHNAGLVMVNMEPELALRLVEALGYEAVRP